MLSSVANQTTKPVFDAILEATGDNGKTTGKSFDDRKVNFDRAKAGSDSEDTSSPVSRSHFIFSRFTFHAKIENLREVRIKRSPRKIREI